MNVILITLDAMRTDSLSIYGGTKKLTPNIDKIAGQSVVFDQCITVANSTGPGHMSIFTGQYPCTHGIRENGWKWKKKIPTIAEIFSQNNYSTVGMSSIEFLSTYYGSSTGFKEFFNNNKWDKYFYWANKFQFKIGRYRFRLISWLRRNKIFPMTHSRRANDTNKDVLPWIRKNHKKPFFMWIQYMTGHLATVEKYEEKTRVLDRAYGELIDLIKELNILDETIIVHMADHGEAFFEHGFRGHSWYLYDEEIKIPFFIYYSKKFKARRFSEQVRTIDIFSTILDLVGIKFIEKTDGKSLLPLIEGKEKFREDAFSECYPVHRISNCIRTFDGWKYILNTDKENELFELNSDPMEKNNLFNSKKEKSADLHERVEKWAKEGKIIERQETEEYTQEVLKGFGYL